MFLCRYILIILITCVSFSVNAQHESKKNKDEKELDGIRYILRQRGKGTELTDSTSLQISIKIYNSKDSLLRDTYTEDFPVIIDLSDSNITKMSIVQIMMNKGRIGDSLTMFIHSDSIFVQEYPLPPFIEKGSLIRQEMKLIKHFTPTEAALAQQDNQESISQKYSKTYYIDTNQEDYIENVYLKLNDITDYKKTKSGLFYRIEKQGTAIKKGEKLRVHYEGTTLMYGGKVGSSFDVGQPLEVILGQGEFIQGWEEGIPLIGKGGKGYLYIPAKLAYGEDEVVGEYVELNAMLIYKIEVLEN
jgi:FKBP-type peptidyl-prolyl cis-trans isomerase